MGYFSEIAITAEKNISIETEPSHLEKLKNWLSYLEDKLSCLESGKCAPEKEEDFWDAVPFYEYDEPNSVYGLRIAIKNIKEKIEAEYDKNMRMLEWRLSVLLKGETPEGQLAFTEMFGPVTEAA